MKEKEKKQIPVEEKQEKTSEPEVLMGGSMDKKVETNKKGLHGTEKKSFHKILDNMKGKSKKNDKVHDDADVLKDRLIRLQADFQNFRNRTIKERAEILRFANENIILEFLPVLDHLALALKAADAHVEENSIIEGFKLVSDQIMSVLSKFGLVPIEAEGKQFDPNIHEAISYLKSKDVSDNVIISQTRCGYMLGDKLLRATQVVVSSGSGNKDKNKDKRKNKKE